MGLGSVEIHCIGQPQGAVERAGVTFSHQVVAFSTLTLFPRVALDHQNIIFNGYINVFGLNPGQGSFNGDVVPFLAYVEGNRSTFYFPISSSEAHTPP